MLKQKNNYSNKKYSTILLVCLAIIAFGSLISSAQSTAPKPCLDFTGTGRTSFVTTVGNNGGGSGTDIVWHILGNGGSGSAQRYSFGRGNLEFFFRDGIIPGYYDGDNQADLAVYRSETTGNRDITFYIRPSTAAANNPNAFYGVQWGGNNDYPLIGDYDGDGRSDVTVIRGDSGTNLWLILSSNTNTFSAVRFGLTSDIKTNGADYNGDGRDEITVIRKNSSGASTYYAGDSRTGALVLAQDWGNSTDDYITGDYIGDRRADFAVIRKRNSGTPLQNATWYILENGGSGQILTRQFGYGAAETSTRDFAVCGDYNGDGKQDIAVYRYTDRAFYWLNSPDFNSFSSQTWGSSDGFNLPVGNLYVYNQQ